MSHDRKAGGGTDRFSASLVYALCAAGAIRHERHGRPGCRGKVVIEEAALEEYRQSCQGKGRQDDAPVPLKHIHLT